MNRQWTRIGLMIGMIWLLGGCSGVSQQARSQVTYFGSFDQLQREPDKYRGTTVIWGGRIISAQALEGTTEFEVLQLELNRGRRPVAGGISQGRFIIRSQVFIDPALYPQGSLITVVGPFKATAQRAIDRMPYHYPVIGIIEIKKWPPGAASPQIHFGIGVGTRF